LSDKSDGLHIFVICIPHAASWRHPELRTGFVWNAFDRDVDYSLW